MWEQAVFVTFYGRHHPTDRAWSQPGVPLALSCLWMFSCCPGSCPGDMGRGACWGQDVAGQIQAQGATIFLRMELLPDAENRQPQGTKEEKDDFGSLHSVLGRKPRLVRAETFCCLGGSCFRTMYWAAPNLSFVTELGQCHSSAHTTCFFSAANSPLAHGSGRWGGR